MQNAAAFRATYSDWRLIKGRKVVQVVFELPLEAADEAYTALGGMPNPAAEVWCAVARLNIAGAGASPASGLRTTVDEPEQHNPGGSHALVPDDEPSCDVPASDEPAPERARKSWYDMTAAQQAGILCNDDGFCKYLRDEYSAIYNATSGPANQSERAAQVVRRICGVASRNLIERNPTATVKWRNLVSDYRAWIRAPEVVG